MFKGEITIKMPKRFSDEAPCEQEGEGERLVTSRGEVKEWRKWGSEARAYMDATLPYQWVGMLKIGKEEQLCCIETLSRPVCTRMSL
jgi:hypothetical protein